MLQPKKKEAFSLLEILIFVTLLNVFFVTAAAIITAMVRNLKFNEHKLVASHYTRQLEEWLRAQKEIDWGGALCSSCTPDTFTEYSSVYATTRYCFTGLSWSTARTTSYTCPSDLDGLYQRYADLTAISSGGYVERVTATIVTSWMELNSSRDVTIKTEFRILE